MFSMDRLPSEKRVGIARCLVDGCSIRITARIGVAWPDLVSESDELVALLEAREQAIVGTEANKRGPYRKGATQRDTG